LPFFKGDVYIRETSGFWHSNQSFDGFFGRHFTDFGKTWYGRIHAWDPAIMTLAQAKKLSMAVKIVALAVTAYALRGGYKKYPELMKFEISALFLFILFVSPASWLNHYITVVFAYYTIINYITDLKNPEKNRRLLTTCIIICSVFTTTGALAISHDIQAKIQSMSGMFLGHLVLFCGILAVLIKEKKAENYER
jgi:hypothetical protein